MRSFFWPPNEVCQTRIEEAICQVTRAIRVYLKRDPISISLLGSLPRGEGVWKVTDDRTHILSDLDVLVATRWRAEAPPALLQRLQELEQKTQVAIDIRLAPLLRLPFYPKNIATYEMIHPSILVWGREVVRWLPALEASELGYNDILFSFFNEVILAIKQLSPSDVVTNCPEERLTFLSHRASKTLFTCASMICLHYGCYQETTAARVAFITPERLTSLPIPAATFLNDLQRALAFRFHQPNKWFFDDAQGYWRRSRRYLMALIRFFLNVQYGTQDIFECLQFAQGHASWREKLQNVYRSLHTSKLLLGHGYTPRWLKRTSPIVYCQMAALMLYLALQEPLDATKVTQAESFLARLYNRKTGQRESLRDRWCRARDELRFFHNRGVF